MWRYECTLSTVESSARLYLKHLLSSVNLQKQCSDNFQDLKGGKKQLNQVNDWKERSENCSPHWNKVLQVIPKEYTSLQIWVYLKLKLWETVAVTDSTERGNKSLTYLLCRKLPEAKFWGKSFKKSFQYCERSVVGGFSGKGYRSVSGKLIILQKTKLQSEVQIS